MSYRLSSRMEHVCCLAQPSDNIHRGTIAEIGCDHAYISMELLHRDCYDHILAMDVKDGPLLRAQKNIKQEFSDDPELYRRIETRKSDGLSAVREHELDAVILAGMGGGLMVRIFTDSLKTFQSIPVLILQPQSELVPLRKFLMEQNYQIVTEDMVFEDGKYYPMMRAERKDQVPQLDLCELTFGPKLLETKHPVLHDYLERKKQKDRMIIKNLEKGESERSVSRIKELEEELDIVEQALKRME